jgi:hypothetical protein
MIPNRYDMLLHSLSLQIAAVYHNTHEVHENAGFEERGEMHDDIITAYRCIRRHIRKGEDGKRFGAAEAHKMMQGEI